MRRAVKELKAEGKFELNPRTSSAYREAERRIEVQLAELLKYEDGLRDATNYERHHAMRIAAKRLRYTIEIVWSLYDGAMDKALEAIKQAQSLLGDIHDCDVWCEHLSEFAKKQRLQVIKQFGHDGPSARLELGIVYLQDLRRSDRQKRFEELVEFWNELKRQDLWNQLRCLVRETGRPSHRALQPQRSHAEKPRGSSGQLLSRWQRSDGRPAGASTGDYPRAGVPAGRSVALSHTRAGNGQGCEAQDA
jgi:hypothetical protein